MEITLKLDLTEVNGLLDTLGQLPTSTNIWPLAAKIRGQAALQIQAPREPINPDSPE
jgi:hypothetical protein